MSKPRSKQEEALQFLDDLDSFEPPPPTAGADPAVPTPPPAAEEEVYAFINEITQKSSEPPRTATSHIERPLSRAGTPTLRKSTERVKVGAPVPLLPASSSGSVSPSLSASASTGSRVSVQGTRPEARAASTPQVTTSQSSGSGGWGWGSVWSGATAALQQAKSVVDEQVKNLPNDQARKWGEGVMEYAKTAQLDKLGSEFKRVGLSTLTDLLNVVAPPISEHEVIQVWLSHDMVGYDGVESLVYRALSRIMEQVEGGDLVVNRGNESRPKSGPEHQRELNAVDSLEAATKMAQANLDEIINKNAPPESTASSNLNPTTYSYVYIRIQPFMAPLVVPQISSSPESSSKTQSSLQFLLYLSDPSHQIVHSTVTQAVPEKWLAYWDEYDWVEDSVVEAIRVGVEVLGQEYIVSRMGWDKKQAEVPAVSVTEAS